MLLVLLSDPCLHDLKPGVRRAGRCSAEVRLYWDFTSWHERKRFSGWPLLSLCSSTKVHLTQRRLPSLLWLLVYQFQLAGANLPETVGVWLKIPRHPEPGSWCAVKVWWKRLPGLHKCSDTQKNLQQACCFVRTSFKMLFVQISACVFVCAHMQHVRPPTAVQTRPWMRLTPLGAHLKPTLRPALRPLCADNKKSGLTDCSCYYRSMYIPGRLLCVCTRYAALSHSAERSVWLSNSGFKTIIGTMLVSEETSHLLRAHSCFLFFLYSTWRNGLWFLYRVTQLIRASPISLFISSLFRVIFVSSAASLHRAAEAVWH